jgi:hypothetical protein
MSSGLRLGFGGEAKDAVNFMEYGENLPPIFIKDIHLMILANLGGFAKKCCRHVNEAMNYVYEVLQGFFNGILEKTSPLGGD